VKRTCEKLAGAIRVETAKLKLALGSLPDDADLSLAELKLRNARAEIQAAQRAIEAASKPRRPRGRPVAAGIDSPDDDEAA
jgi:hypothetical protein